MKIRHTKGRIMVAEFRDAINRGGRYKLTSGGYGEGAVGTWYKSVNFLSQKKSTKR